MLGLKGVPQIYGFQLPKLSNNSRGGCELPRKRPGGFPVDIPIDIQIPGEVFEISNIKKVAPNTDPHQIEMSPAEFSSLTNPSCWPRCRRMDRCSPSYKIYK